MARRGVIGSMVVVAALTAAACGADSGVATERADAEGVPTTDPSDDTATAGTAPDPTPSGGGGTLDWQEQSEGVEVAVLEVPVDYDDPDGDTFHLFVARHLAADQENKIGSLLTNPGGPGFGGTEFALYAELVFGEPLLERFDIVGWDPRGTALTEPAIDCIDDYDQYFAGYDITPDDQAEYDQIVDNAEDFAANCEEKNAAILPHIGTNNSARDIDALRRALGENQISYFGFSYGSELGATWATLFPETVRAAVLDGASDPTADALTHGLQQAAGFEATLTTYLAQCSADDGCTFHNDGDAEGAFDTLMAELDEQPIPSTEGRPDVTRGVALQAVTQAMYAETYWKQLSDGLADAQDGDGEGLLALYDAYYQRQSDGTWGNELEAFQSISCMDREERPTVEESDAQAAQYNAVAPRFAPGTTGDYMCTFYPPTVDPRIDITGANAGPIVVVGTTGDAATPLASTRAMASTLEDGRLIVVTADQHTGYQVNDCVDDAIHAYLVDLEVPAEETQC